MEILGGSSTPLLFTRIHIEVHTNGCKKKKKTTTNDDDKKDIPLPSSIILFIFLKNQNQK